MYRRIYLILYVLLIPAGLWGQEDKQANQILDRFSSRATSSASVDLKFTLVTHDQVENRRDSIEGSVVISGDRYNLKLPDNIIWFDGVTAWNYLPAEKEVTITKPDKKDDSFQSRPSSLFTMYKKGYKTRLIEETTTSYLIDLYPEDHQSELVRVRLSIGKSNLALKSFEYKRRDGITHTIKIQSYNLGNKVDPSAFTFKPADYKGVDIIDIR